MARRLPRCVWRIRRRRPRWRRTTLGTARPADTGAATTGTAARQAWGNASDSTAIFDNDEPARVLVDIPVVANKIDADVDETTGNLVMAKPIGFVILFK